MTLVVSLYSVGEREVRKVNRKGPVVFVALILVVLIFASFFSLYGVLQVTAPPAIRRIAVQVAVNGETLPGLISIQFDIAEAGSGQHSIGIDERIGVDYGAIVAYGTIKLRNLYAPFDTNWIGGTSWGKPFQLVVNSTEIGQPTRTISFDEVYLVGKSFYSEGVTVESEYRFEGTRVRFMTTTP
jgi:hypothetical protein